MNLATISANLKTELAKITTLKAVHATVPPHIAQTPCAVLGEPVIEYDDALGDDGAVIRWPVYLLTGSQDQQQAQTAMFAYMAASGATTTVKGCLERDTTLSGAVDSLRVVSSDPQGLEDFAEAKLLARTFNVEIYA